MKESKVVKIRGRVIRSGKTRREKERVINRMLKEGWTLVNDTSVGALGGNLTFVREKP